MNLTAISGVAVKWHQSYKSAQTQVSEYNRHRKISGVGKQLKLKRCHLQKVNKPHGRFLPL